MPSSPSYVRNYRQEYLANGASAKQKKQRAARNKARAEAVKSGKVRKGDGKDIDHKIPLNKGGSKSKSNTRVQSASKNRSNGGKQVTGAAKNPHKNKTKSKAKKK
jgi:hypothetical protein